jgi:O-antigen/teichoic acid export membrane protein
LFNTAQGKSLPQDLQNNTAVLPSPEDAGTRSSRLPSRAKMQKMFSWGTKGGLAILEYGLIAGSNFILSFLLARWMSPEQYGAYGLGFSIFLLLSFLYQALLLEPMSVYGGSNYRENLRGYMRTSLKMHNAISLGIFLVFAAAAAVTFALGKSPALAGALAGLTIASPCIFLFWLGRRGFYLKISPGPAALGAVLYFVMVLGGVFVVYRLHVLSTFSAFLVMGLAALVCGIALMLALRNSLDPSATVPDLRQTWRKHWVYGRWALGSSIVGWIPTYFYFTVVSVFAGIAQAGELRALMNLAGPVLQTYAALSMLFLPYAARVQSKEGTAGTYALNWRLTALFTAGAVVYWAAVLPFRTQIFHLLYAGKYDNVVHYLPFFAIETVVWAASVGASIVLRAMESPRSMFVANCAASAITFIVGIPATKLFGLWGVVWSIILANCAALVITIVLLRRKSLEGGTPALDFAAPLPMEDGI